MIKEVINDYQSTCIEVTIEHPVAEIGEVSMFVFKILENLSYIFSIPFHNWAFQKGEKQDINFIHAPSGFIHPQYKPRLITAMQQSIEILEHKTM